MSSPEQANDPPAETCHQGRPASPGIAIGPLIAMTLDAPAASILQAGPAEEEQRLDDALRRARADLAALAEAHGGEGAEILEFQIEMLADPALVEGVRTAIAEGVAAATAWQDGLEEQIAGFLAADDDYFRARSSDLADLQDRVTRLLTLRQLEAVALPEGAVLLDRDLTPSRFLALDWTRLGGIALMEGSPSSHVAMLARGRGVPLVTGLGAVAATRVDAILDGGSGLLITHPGDVALDAYAARRRAAAEQARLAAIGQDQPAITADGERVQVMINVDDPDAIDDAILRASDGVGLLRTEFLFIGRNELPSEDEQFEAYADLLDRLEGRPCVIRTLDVGGDKPLPGISLPAESNPFLGLRGVRLCLDRPALFRPQIRALLRAASGRPLQVMLPMIASPAEFDEVRALFETCLAELRAENRPAAMPPLGIMVETPAAALTLDLFDAAFYSIGSNDLIQYVMAAARDSGGRVALLADPLQPAVQRLIAGIVASADAAEREIGLCGEMASDAAALPSLLALGLRKLSVAPTALGRVKLQIAGWTRMAAAAGSGHE